jgi:hypothetical protein
MNKKEIFFDLAKKMNEKFSIIPLLSGSLALQMLLNEEIPVADMDISVPQDYNSLSGKWRDMLAFMQSEGYKLTNLFDREFSKGEIKIELGAIDGEKYIRTESGAIDVVNHEDLPSFEEISNLFAEDCPVIIEGGAVYKRPTLEQHLYLYTLAADCRWRHYDDDTEGYVNSDLERIPFILRALKRSEDYEYYRDKDFPIRFREQHYSAPQGITYNLAQPDTKYPELYPKWDTADAAYKYCYDTGYRCGYADGLADGKNFKHGDEPPRNPRTYEAFRMNPKGISGRNDGYGHGQEDGYGDGYYDGMK